MEKVKRKRVLNQLAKKDLAEFRKVLPISESVFPKLFDFLDNQLSEQDCQDNFAIAGKFCEKHNIDKQLLFDWLHEQGQACDCEILNLQDAFEYLKPPVTKTPVKAAIKKQKLNSLTTDFGFRIDRVTSPWILTETLLEEKSIYTFQFGKGTDCIVSLEASFPAEQIFNDRYWLDLWIEETNLDHNIEDLVVERPEIDNYTCILVKSKNWIPVFYFFRNNLTDKWFLKMRTVLSRHKGDFKEFSKLLSNIHV